MRSPWPLFRQAGGEWVVLGEALVANPAGGAALSRVSLEVLGPDGTVVASRRYVPADFDQMVLGDPGLSGTGAVLFVWTTLNGPAPARARVRIELSDARAFDREVPLTLFEPGFQARPPVPGGPWVAHNSFGAANHWLGSLLPNETATQFWVGERFAIDMVLLGFDGNLFPDTGAPAAVEDFYAWGQPVSAIAPGRVAAVETHHADQPLGEHDGQSFTGNVVVIEHAPGIYGWYAHLMQGSVAVEPGDEMAAGGLLGRVGNSGNTEFPHLHVHLSDRPESYRAQGLPLTFSAGRMLVFNDQVDDIVDVLPLENGALPNDAFFIAPGAIAEAGVVHAASWRTGPLAPGQIFSINGEGLGPPNGVGDLAHQRAAGRPALRGQCAGLRWFDADQCACAGRRERGSVGDPCRRDRSEQNRNTVGGVMCEVLVGTARRRCRPGAGRPSLRRLGVNGSRPQGLERRTN